MQIVAEREMFVFEIYGAADSAAAARGGHFLVHVVITIFSSQTMSLIVEDSLRAGHLVPRESPPPPPVTGPAPPNRTLWVLKCSVTKARDCAKSPQMSSSSATCPELRTAFAEPDPGRSRPSPAAPREILGAAALITALTCNSPTPR